MAANPILSIIVPVYNVEKYLNECIDSILNQTFQDYEIILVDDGSTDLSGKICDEYKKIDSRITVVHQENSGAAIARLNGINKANGTYLGFVDGDDWIDSKMYTDMIEIAVSSESDIVMSGYIIEKQKNEECIDIINKNNISDFFIFNSSILAPYWNKIIKKDLFESINFPITRRINMYEDNFVTFKLLNLTNKVFFMQNNYYHYRNVSNSQSKKYTVQFFNDIAYVINDLESFAKSINKYDCYEKYFANEKLNLKLKIIESSLKNKYNFARDVFPECNKIDITNWRGIISRLKLRLLIIHFDFCVSLLNIFEKHCMRIIRSKN